MLIDGVYSGQTGSTRKHCQSVSVRVRMANQLSCNDVHRVTRVEGFDSARGTCTNNGFGHSCIVTMSLPVHVSELCGDIMENVIY